MAEYIVCCAIMVFFLIVLGIMAYFALKVMTVLLKDDVSLYSYDMDDMPSQKDNTDDDGRVVNKEQDDENVKLKGKIIGKKIEW